MGLRQESEIRDQKSAIRKTRRAMSENNNAIQNVAGDGRALPVSSDELSQLKSDLTQIASQANIFMQQRNEDGATRFCEWDGRSSDGRKYASRTNKIPPLFDGQPDAQIFLTDTAVRIKSAELCQAAKRMNVTFEPSSRDDDAEAGARICEARYLWARRRMGSAYLNEQRRAANWFLDGTPAGVVWFAGWKRLTQLRMKRMTVDEAAVSILKNYFEQQDGGPVQEPSPSDLELMRSYLTVNEPEVITAAVELLTTALGIEATTARFVLKQFQEEGVDEREGRAGALGCGRDADGLGRGVVYIVRDGRTRTSLVACGRDRGRVGVRGVFGCDVGVVLVAASIADSASSVSSLTHPVASISMSALLRSVR